MNKKITEFKKVMLALLIVYDIFAVGIGGVVLYAIGHISFGGLICTVIFVGLPLLGTFKVFHSYRIDKAILYNGINDANVPQTKEEEKALLKKTSEKKKENFKSSMIKLGNDFKVEMRTVHCEHVAGLPLAENTKCDVYFAPDEFVITGSGNTFKLKYDKVTDVTVKTDTEISKQYVSSIGGAVAGGVLFGPIGAIIGGRAKQKKIKTSSKYLIITYLKDGNIDYIGFDVTAVSTYTEDCVKRIKELIKGSSQESIEL